MNKFKLFPKCTPRESLKIQSQPFLVHVQELGEIDEDDINYAQLEEIASPIGIEKPNLIISSINNLPKDEFGQDIMLLEKESIKRKAMLVEDTLRALPDKSNVDYKFWLNKLMHEMFTLGSRVQEHNDFVEHLYALRATEKYSKDRTIAGESSPKKYQSFIDLINVIVSDIKLHTHMSKCSRANLAPAIDALFSINTISPPSHKTIKTYINDAYGSTAKKGRKSNSAPSLKEVEEWVKTNYKDKIHLKS